MKSVKDDTKTAVAVTSEVSQPKVRKPRKSKAQKVNEDAEYDAWVEKHAGNPPDYETQAKTAEGRLKIKKACDYLVRAYDIFQNDRKRLHGILNIKADGSPRNSRQEAPPDVVYDLTESSKSAFAQEKHITNLLKTRIIAMPIWKEFLSKIPGMGIQGAAYIIGSYNIQMATTVSKLIQFTGMNPGKVPGKKRVNRVKDPANYVLKTGELEVVYRGDDYVIVKTNTMVRGDCKTKGFVCPFNSNLRVKVLGIIGANFSLARVKRGRKKQPGDAAMPSLNPYMLEVYYPEKERLAHSEDMTTERKRNGEIAELPWKDCSLGHRHRAAMRKTMKAFLRDLYVAWRTLEGLPVRESYQAQYLGHVHSGKETIVSLDSPALPGSPAYNKDEIIPFKLETVDEDGVDLIGESMPESEVVA